MTDSNHSSHDYHRVGEGAIWCCSRCGFAVEVIRYDKTSDPSGAPMERACFGTFKAMVEYIHQACHKDPYDF